MRSLPACRQTAALPSCHWTRWGLSPGPRACCSSAVPQGHVHTTYGACELAFGGLTRSGLVSPRHPSFAGHHLDTLGIEPRASRMLSGCDTTTPRAHEHHTAVVSRLHQAQSRALHRPRARSAAACATSGLDKQLSGPTSQQSLRHEHGNTEQQVEACFLLRDDGNIGKPQAASARIREATACSTVGHAGDQESSAT